MKLFVAFVFLALNFYTYHFLATNPVIPPRERFDTFPLEIGEWQCPKKQEIPAEIQRNLGATDYLVCDYHRDDPREDVSVYVGYHETQIREEGGGSGENAIHPPAHCLPGSGWDIIHSDTVPIDSLPGLPESPAFARRLVIAKGDMRQLVYYWYQSRGRIIAVDWEKIVYVGLDRALRGRTDGSLVRFSVPIERDGGEERAEAAFQDLATQITALLPAYIPE